MDASVVDLCVYKHLHTATDGCSPPPQVVLLQALFRDRTDALLPRSQNTSHRESRHTAWKQDKMPVGLATLIPAWWECWAWKASRNEEARRRLADLCYSYH